MTNIQPFDYSKTENQVFILHSACNIPILFATHTWLVTNRKGHLARYEVRHFKSPIKNHGYLHINTLPPFQGIELFRSTQKLKWNPKLITTIEDPAATEMIELIESSLEKYPYINKYRLTKENSNTYTQWIINHFPELNIKLPWNSFGKKKNI